MFFDEFCFRVLSQYCQSLAAYLSCDEKPNSTGFRLKESRNWLSGKADTGAYSRLEELVDASESNSDSEDSCSENENDVEVQVASSGKCNARHAPLSSKRRMALCSVVLRRLKRKRNDDRRKRRKIRACLLGSNRLPRRRRLHSKNVKKSEEVKVYRYS